MVRIYDRLKEGVQNLKYGSCRANQSPSVSFPAAFLGVPQRTVRCGAMQCGAVRCSAVHSHEASWPRGGIEDAFSSAWQDPGPLSEEGSAASSKPLLAEPSEENSTTIVPPSSENWAYNK